MSVLNGLCVMTLLCVAGKSPSAEELRQEQVWGTWEGYSSVHARLYHLEIQPQGRAVLVMATGPVENSEVKSFRLHTVRVDKGHVEMLGDSLDTDTMGLRIRGVGYTLNGSVPQIHTTVTLFGKRQDDTWFEETVDIAKERFRERLKILETQAEKAIDRHRKRSASGSP